MSPVSVLSRRGSLTLLLTCMLCCLALPAVTLAEEAPKRVTVKDLITFTWSLAPEDPFSNDNAVGAMPKFRRGETFFLTITGKPKAGYHTYPLTMRTEQQSLGNSTLTYSPSKSFTPLWPIVESDPEVFDEGPMIGLNLEHDKPFTWTQEILVTKEAKPGLDNLAVRIRLQVCDDNRCTPGDYPLEIPVTVASSDPVDLTPSIQKKMKSGPPDLEIVPVDPTTPIKKHSARPPERGPAEKTITPPESSGNETSDGNDDSEDQTQELTKFREKSFLRFILEGFGWGLLSLFTPCVFPMIPITVSFFLKQSEQEHNSPLALAAVYSGTIIVVLLIGGLTVVYLLQPVSQHYLTNFILGLLFLFFALSLFGMYEIALPSSLANFTYARQGRGGVIGTFFMALTFTIISFACVAPFYGSFLIISASSASLADFTKLFFGALAYSMAFASPFFILALFPTLLKAIPRSGSWMNTMKVVMGFIELAAGLKFLRGAELGYFHSTSILTFDLVLGIYVALTVLCGLYLLGLFRLPHDYDAPQMLSVPRLLFSLAFISLGLYLMPALFKQGDGKRQRPRGEVFGWVESFLLPDAPPKQRTGPTNGTKATAELRWGAHRQSALAEAAEQRKYIFVDFTGHN